LGWEKYCLAKSRNNSFGLLKRERGRAKQVGHKQDRKREENEIMCLNQGKKKNLFGNFNRRGWEKGGKNVLGISQGDSTAGKVTYMSVG